MKSVLPGFLLTLALLAPSSCAQAPKKAVDFQTFWTEFRQAALASNVEKVASMTQFPFKTRGTLDSSTPVSHSRGEFPGLWKKLMEQDTGLNEQPEPMRKYIEKKAAAAASPGGKARMANFIFENAGGTWLFTMAYTEE